MTFLKLIGVGIIISALAFVLALIVVDIILPMI